MSATAPPMPPPIYSVSSPARGRVYSDPHREMLRVAGQGAPLAKAYENLASTYVTVWSFGIPGPFVAKAADGRVFSVHAVERMLEQGITRREVLEALYRGTRHWDTEEKAWAFLGKTAAGRQLYVAISEETGKIITVYWRSKGLNAARWIPWP